MQTIPAIPPIKPTDLLRNSVPQPVFRHGWLVLVLAWAAAMLCPVFTENIGIIILVILQAIVLTGCIFFYALTIMRGFKAEDQQLSDIEDMIQLRQHEGAVYRLVYMLNCRMYTLDHRAKALVMLAATLARVQRLEDAIALQNAILDEKSLTPSAEIVVKIGRAMVMLQSDHLYDADRAIADLRRRIGRVEQNVDGTDDAQPIQRDPVALAALRLVEIYRDVKTGHADEAVAVFQNAQDLLRSALGHRAGEAYALVACAYVRLGNLDIAQQWYKCATALQPLDDLKRRYPEVAGLPSDFVPTYAPSIV